MQTDQALVKLCGKLDMSQRVTRMRLLFTMFEPSGKLRHFVFQGLGRRVPTLRPCIARGSLYADLAQLAANWVIIIIPLGEQQLV